jgi:hypothetical protein
MRSRGYQTDLMSPTKRPPASERETRVDLEAIAEEWVMRSRVLSRQLTWLVAGALVVMAAARFVPLGAAQIVIGVAGGVAFRPLAYEMWTSRSAGRTGEPQSARAN